MFLKIAGALLLIISSLFIGAQLVGRVDEALKNAAALRSLLEHTKFMIDAYSLPVGKILEGVSEELLSECRYPKGKRPENFLELALRSDICDRECGDIFLAFAKDFGKGTRGDELARCSSFLERLRAREQKLYKESAKKKKLIMTLAPCSAIAAVILLI